jgi:ATP-dependent 26S proteasome regulatory subunit
MALTQAPVMPVRTGDAHLEYADLLREHLDSGYQLIFTSTSEEARVLNEIRIVAQTAKGGNRKGLNLITWDNFEGLQGDALKLTKDQQEKTRDIMFTLKALGESTLHEPSNKGMPAPAVLLPNNAIYVFHDLDDYFVSERVRRALRAMFATTRFVNDKQRRPMIILSPQMTIHPKLRSAVTVLDFQLPNEKQLGDSLEFIRASWAATEPEKANVSEALRDKIVGTLAGLTSVEAENALSRCITRHKEFSDAMIPTLKDEKASVIRKSEVLTYKDDSQITNRDEIGGYDALMEFIDRRKQAYTHAARELKIDNPKGIVLIGPPGTGKSVVAEMIAKAMELPLYMMDVGAVFGSLVGESEARMRDAIRQIGAQQGCVLLIDEADKAWGNAHDSRGDSGVTQRVFGQLLSWLAGKKDRTFVVMTMNRTTGIPPEFLRAGRFDAVFFTDIPTATERRQILEIHFKKRGVDLNQLAFTEADWEQVILETEGCVGAELEEIVKESRYRAFEARGAGVPTFTEVITSRKAITPLSELDAEGVKAIRDFCASRAKPVTHPVLQNNRRARQQRGLTN